jgi:hypothetical protein
VSLSTLGVNLARILLGATGADAVIRAVAAPRAGTAPGLEGPVAGDLECRYYSDPDRRRLADAAPAWAATQARERGEDADRIIAAHPGFTTATHVTEGTLIVSTPTQPGI